GIAQRRGRLVEALALQERALARRVRLYGARSDGYATSVGNVGKLQLELGRIAPALANLERAHRLSVEILGPQHELTLDRSGGLASGLNRAGRAAEAVRVLEAAIAAHGTTGDA